MSTAATDYTLAELVICAGSEAFRNDGEVLVTGIGLIPRLAGSLAMKTCNTDLLMTDSAAMMLSEPNPVGERPTDFVQMNESRKGLSRTFANVWGCKRHAMVATTQLDRFGQANSWRIGRTHQQP